MINKEKRTVLLISALIIGLVVVSSFAMSNADNNISFLNEFLTSSADYQKNDRPADTDIIQLSNSTLRGVEGDQSAYTSVNSVLTLGDNIFVSDGTGQKIFRLSSDGEVDAAYTSAVTVNAIATDGNYIYALTGSLDGAIVRLTKNFDIYIIELHKFKDDLFNTDIGNLV